MLCPQCGCSEYVTDSTTRKLCVQCGFLLDDVSVKLDTFETQHSQMFRSSVFNTQRVSQRASQAPQPRLSQARAVAVETNTDSETYGSALRRLTLRCLEVMANHYGVDAQAVRDFADQMFARIEEHVDMSFTQPFSTTFPQFRAAVKTISRFRNRHKVEKNPSSPQADAPPAAETDQGSSKRRVYTSNDINVLKEALAQQLAGPERELLEGNLSPALLLRKMLEERREARDEEVEPDTKCHSSVFGYKSFTADRRLLFQSTAMRNMIPLIVTYYALSSQRFVPPQVFVRDWAVNRLPVYNFAPMDDKRHDFNLPFAEVKPYAQTDLLEGIVCLHKPLGLPLPEFTLGEILAGFLHVLCLPAGLRQVFFALPFREEALLNINTTLAFIFITLRLTVCGWEEPEDCFLWRYIGKYANTEIFPAFVLPSDYAVARSCDTLRGVVRVHAEADHRSNPARHHKVWPDSLLLTKARALTELPPLYDEPPGADPGGGQTTPAQCEPPARCATPVKQPSPRRLTARLTTGLAFLYERLREQSTRKRVFSAPPEPPRFRGHALARLNTLRETLQPIESEFGVITVDEQLSALENVSSYTAPKQLRPVLNTRWVSLSTAEEVVLAIFAHRLLVSVDQLRNVVIKQTQKFETSVRGFLMSDPTKLEEGLRVPLVGLWRP